jgi:primosomal protein N' (replication factor Y) (superfamily II helicase)
VRLVDLALPVPLAHVFTYTVSDELASGVVPGVRVVAPFGTRKLVGVVLGVREGEPPPKVRDLESVLPHTSLPEELLGFLRDVASYYMAPIGEVVRMALPPLDREAARAVAEPSLFDESRGVGARKVRWLRASGRTHADESKLTGQAKAILAHLRSAGEAPLARIADTWKNARTATKRLADLGLIEALERDVPDDPFFADPATRDAPPELTAHQAEAARSIEEALVAGAPRTLLLHGVTGSGKTEVYLRAIAAARAAKKGAIVLVPEIALTPQLVARYRARFGDDVAVIHSALTPKERLAMWRRLRDAELDVAIGARSALFAPVAHLGLLVVDEEHDPSFKQEENVRYHARDMAILRAHRAAGVCVLGSATPSLESEHLARTGKAQKLRLPARARAQAMPRVEIVDLRHIGAGPTGDKRISIPLHRALEQTLAAREQAILFLNRRGFSPSVRCEACGEMATCPHCAVSLTFHKRAGAVLRCHYCEHEEPMRARCGKCGAPALALEGLGTEKLEETLAAAFPEATVARLDRDVASGKNVEKVLARMRSREIDVLVGTQMVTKGHDLPHVTLVGVINADAALSIPDFRASERAFQLLVQVAGRAGRGDVPGRVVVQTYQPDHHAIRLAVKHDVEGFLDREIVDRKELLYPPFSRIALVRVDALEEEAARGACHALAAVARDAERAEPQAASKVDILGPSPAPIARLRNRWRFRMMLRSPDRGRLRRVLAAVDRARADLPRPVRSSVDVDPMHLL